MPAALFLNENALNVMHHTKRAPITAELLEMGQQHMRATLGPPKPRGAPPHMGRVLMSVTIAWPDRVRRDTHNFMPMLKPLVDGFVKAGLLEDDREEFLIGPHIWPADKLYKAPYGKHAWLDWTITEIPPRVTF